MLTALPYNYTIFPRKFQMGKMYKKALIFKAFHCIFRQFEGQTKIKILFPNRKEEDLLYSKMDHKVTFFSSGTKEFYQF